MPSSSRKSKFSATFLRAPPFLPRSRNSSSPRTRCRICPEISTGSLMAEANPKKRRTDYLAELYVAGVLADAGWNVYFPHRDEGFDFIISKLVSGRILLRPVQVKGKYPEEGKSNKSVYGYVGRLTAIHSEMVLA